MDKQLCLGGGLGSESHTSDHTRAASRSGRGWEEKGANRRKHQVIEAHIKQKPGLIAHTQRHTSREEDREDDWQEWRRAGLDDVRPPST